MGNGGSGDAQRDWHRLTEEFADESDRASALVAAALLDLNLEDLLRAHLIDDHDQVDLLLASGLRNLIIRVRACYCLGLISNEERHDLRLINELRNTFAHDLHVSFEDPSLRKRCARFKLIRRVVSPGTPVPPRQALEQTTCMLSVLLVRRLEEVQTVRPTRREDMSQVDFTSQCPMVHRDDGAG